jgi:PBSX family phage terminase large subunit
MTGPTTIRVLPKQKRFITSPAKYPAFIGGVGSGKTRAGCLRALLRLNKGLDGMIVAPTYPMMRDVTQRTFFQWADELGVKYYFSKSEEKVEIAGAVVLFRTADAPDRLRGPNLNWAYLDEAAMMTERTWKVILGRLHVGEPSAWITTTPAGFNWIWRTWVDKQDPNYEMIHARTVENTFLPHGYLDDMVASYTGEFASQEIEGNFVAFEGLVYPEFSREIHVQEKDVGAATGRYRSVDFGYTNPFVCLWGATDEDGRLHIYDEHYRPKMLIREHAEVIKARAGVFGFTVADHDAQDVAEMGAVGIGSRPAQKDVIRGIQKLKARLAVQADKRPRLTISPKCVNTIREFGSYRWQESRENRNEKEEPVKENDHAMDALRYMVFELDNQKLFFYAGKD